MHAEIAELWTTELRSGRFTQGWNALRSSQDEYCCLGVLCEIAVREGVIPAAMQPYRLRDYVYGVSSGDWHRNDRSNSVLPHVVMEWAGISTGVGILANGSMLTTINDDGTSFADIADIIDANVDVL